MSKTQFPRWVFGAQGASKLLRTAEDEDALVGEWHDSPALVSDAAPEAEGPAQSPADNEGARLTIDTMQGEDASVLRKRLEAQAETVSLKVDKRWSNETLQRMIFEKGSS